MAEVTAIWLRKAGARPEALAAHLESCGIGAALVNNWNLLGGTTLIVPAFEQERAERALSETSAVGSNDLGKFGIACRFCGEKTQHITFRGEREFGLLIVVPVVAGIVLMSWGWSTAGIVMVSLTLAAFSLTSRWHPKPSFKCPSCKRRW